MRLFPINFDATFNPVVMLMGVLFVLTGLYAVALFRHALQHPIVLVVAAIPALFAVIGVLIVIREIQLFRRR
jgi:hypothetical protein